MGIYVVGMHRSGTSAVAGLVSALRRLPSARLAVTSNPSGQWERPELRPALELLLAWNRKTWAHAPVETDPLAAPAPLLAYAARVFAQHCSDRFLWKDPRLCLTIDRWLGLPQDEPRVVFVHRRAADVARSLQQRNGWPIERGLALWERTNRNAVVRLGGREVFAIDHANLIEDPASVVVALARWLEPEKADADLDAVDRAVAIIDRTGASSEPNPSASGAGRTGGRATSAQEALAERLGRACGPTGLDLDGLGDESPTTASILGTASASDLLRRTARASLASPRRHRLEIAGGPVQ